MKNDKIIAVRSVNVRSMNARSSFKTDVLDNDPAFAIGSRLGSIDVRLKHLEDQVQDRKVSKKQKRTVMTNALKQEINLMISNAVEYTRSLIISDLIARGVISEETFPNAPRDDKGRLAVTNPVGGEN